jgi:hypothetical protein
LLAGEVVDEFHPICVVLADVVVVDRSLDQLPGTDERIDRSGGGVS